MPGEIEQAAIVDDQAVGVLADHRRSSCGRRGFPAAPRRSPRTPQCDSADGLQVLVDDEARPDQPREAEHQREQPHDPGDAGLVSEHDLEVGEINSRRAASRSGPPDPEHDPSPGIRG